MHPIALVISDTTVHVAMTLHTLPSPRLDRQRFPMDTPALFAASARNLAAALVFWLCLAGAAPAATLQFVSGSIVNVGEDINCVSQVEIREQAYAGYALRDGRIPGVGERWYAHVVISHPGNPCPSGGSATGIEIVLPPNTAFAIDTANPLFCAVRTSGGQVSVYYRSNQGCSQTPSTGLHGYYLLGLTIASGTFLELMVPLVSSKPLTAATVEFVVNDDVGVYGTPQDNAVYVTSDVVFRTDFDNDVVVPDVCLLSGTVSCALAP